MINIVRFNTGKMPNTKGQCNTYELLENMLASYFISLAPLTQGRHGRDDTEPYTRSIATLHGFSQKYNIQTPELTITHSRINYSLPHELSSHEMYMATELLSESFGIGTHKNTAEYEEVKNLQNDLLKVFRNYDIAELNLCPVSKNRIYRLNGWNPQKRDLTLFDVIIEGR